MDQIIELMAFYWADWQQTAIANTRYSVALAAAAFFIGTFVLAILKSGKINKLQKQLMQNRQLLEQAKEKQDEMVKQQTADASQITTLQQQLEQTTTTMQQQAEQGSAKLQQEIEKHQADIASKDEIFLKSVKEKQVELDGINSKLEGQNKLSEQLQNELNEQKDNIAQYDEVKAQLTGLEQQLTNTSGELTTVKSQLETELQLKDTLLEKVDSQAQATKTQIDRVLNLESQLSTMTTSQEAEKIQRQLADNKQKEQDVLNLELKKAKMQQEAKIELEKQITPPVTPVQRKEVPAIKQPAVSVQEPQTKKTEQVKPAKVEVKKAEKQGITGKVLGWFASMDNALEGEDTSNQPKAEQDQPKTVEKTIAEPTVDDTPIIKKPEQVVTPIAVVKPKVEQPVVSAEKIEAVKPSTTVQKPKVVNNVIDDDEASFSEKLADVADKMDALQGKLKGFFNKK